MGMSAVERRSPTERPFRIPIAVHQMRMAVVAWGVKGQLLPGSLAKDGLFDWKGRHE